MRAKELEVSHPSKLSNPDPEPEALEPLKGETSLESFKNFIIKNLQRPQNQRQKIRQIWSKKQIRTL